MKGAIFILLLSLSFFACAGAKQGAVQVLSKDQVLEYATNYLEIIVKDKGINIIEEIQFVGKQHKYLYRGYNYWYVDFKCNESAVNYQNRNFCPYTLEMSDEGPPKLLNSYQNIF